MAYIGQQPVVGRYILLDQISGGFNGTTSGFTMSTAGGVQGVVPGLAQNVLLSLGGVIQQPGVDYTISGSGLTFTTPPVSGTTFFATVLGDAQSVGTPSDGTVTPASIASGYNFAFPNLTITGVTTIASGSASAPSLSITGDSNTGLYSPGADQLALATNSSERIRIGTNGEIGLAGANYGTSGQVLTSAGSGAAPTWTTPSVGNTDKISEGNSSAEVIDTGSDGRFVVTTEGSERLRVDSSGRLGIGTASPSQALDVSGAIHFSTNLLSGTTSNLSYPGKILNIKSGQGYGGINVSDSEARIFSTWDTTPIPITFYLGGAECARIDSAGRLLVGTSSARSNIAGIAPQSQIEGTTYNTSSFSLTLNSNDAQSPYLEFVKTRATSNGGVTVVQSGDQLGYIGFAGADGSDVGQNAAAIAAYVDGTPGANDMPGRLVFSTTADGASSPTERMRITSGGVVNIGTSGSTLGPSTTSTGITLYPGDYSVMSAAGNEALTLNRNNDGNILSCRRSGTNVGSISVTTTATAFNTSSDYRLKENVVPLTGAADRLNQLQVHRFNFIADPDKTVDGFLAHEAQAVVPECVTGEKDAVDNEGNPIYQGIDQSKLVPLLTAALQETIAELQALKAEVAALKAQ